MDVTDSNFQEKVIEASKKKLIIVDFWADWCVPCNMLAPVLDKVVEGFKEKVALAKVNVDQCPQRANEYAINAIPAVKLFKNAAAVHEPAGRPPVFLMSAIEDFICS